MTFSEQEQQHLLDIARHAILERLDLTHEEPGNISHPAWNSPGASFVTLKKRGQLRGCIGTIIRSNTPLLQNIRQNACSAAFDDPRFPPVTADEIHDIDISISILTDPEPLHDPESFKLGVDGIIMELRGHRAVFLPCVATEQNWNQKQTLDHLSTKAGLSSEAWREPACEFSIFQSIDIGKN